MTKKRKMCNEDYLNNLIQFRGNVRILNKITLSFDNLTLEYGYSNENIKIIDKKGGRKKSNPKMLKSFKNHKNFFRYVVSMFRVSFNTLKHRSVQFQRGQFPRTDNSNLIPWNLHDDITEVWTKKKNIFERKCIIFPRI